MSDLGDLGIAEARHLAAERQEPLGYRKFGKAWHRVAKNDLAGLTRSPLCQTEEACKMSQIVTCYFEIVGKATALPKLSRWIDKVTALSKQIRRAKISQIVNCTLSVQENNQISKKHRCLVRKREVHGLNLMVTKLDQL